MNSRLQFRQTKCMILSAALSFPGASVFAASTVIAKDDVDQHYGRDSVFVPQPPLVLLPSAEPQMYGRSGGYAGTDRVTAMEAIPDRSSDVVKPGESTTEQAKSAATSEPSRSQQTQTVTSQASGTQDNVRVGDRFDNSAHAQRQTDMLSRYSE